MADGEAPLILVVDDNPDHRFLARQELSRDGNYRVETAESGAEALARIKEESFSLVLLDYNMPGMNGHETLSQILAIDPELPVVMLTGGGSESVAVGLIKAGAYDYVVKSDDYLATLPAVVSSALQRRQLQEKTKELERERLKLTKLSAIVETAIAVNHEVNNPLFAIKANTQLLQRRCASDDPKIVRPIEGILESCERISEVTRKLANLIEPASKSYAGEGSMLDLGVKNTRAEAAPAPPLEPIESQSGDSGDYLPVLWQINRALSSSLDTDHILRELVIAVADLIKGTACAIGLVESEALRVRVYSYPDEDGKIIASEGEATPYPLSGIPTVRQVLASDEPIVIESPDDPRLSEMERAILQGYNVRSVVAAPISLQGKPMGILVLGRFDRAVSRRESVLCQLIAGQVHFAIDNALQHEDLRKRTEQLQALVSGMEAVSSKLGLRERLDSLVQLAANLMNAHIASIRLLEGKSLVLGAYAGEYEGPIRQSQRTNWGLGRLVLESDEPVVIEDMHNDQRTAVRVGVRPSESFIESYMGVRLVARGKTIGLMGVFTKGKRHFTPEDIGTFVSLANQAATAIDNARLYEEVSLRASELTEKAERIRLKNEIVQAILASNRIEDICGLVAREAPRLIQCDCVAITLVDWDREVHRVIAGWPAEMQELVPGMEVPFADTPISDLLVDARPVIIGDYLQLANLKSLSARLVEKGIRSSLLMPVSFHGRVLGAIAFGSKQAEGFGADHLPIAQELADQAAVAIQNALLLERVMVSKAEWEATFDAITDPVWVQTPECLIVKVNRAAADSVGAEPQDVIGKRCHGSFYGGPLACDRCPVQRAIETATPQACEYENGDSLTFLASAYPVLAEDGRVLATVAYIKEITEQKRVQQQLLRSAKLAAVGELAAGVAHNFNNLLTGVRGAIELLHMQAERENLPPKISARLQSIKERLDHGDAIVRRLLAFARNSSEQPTEVDLGSVIRGALEICETHSARKGLQVEAVVPEGLPMVFGIESHLEQVLVNLIINAFQASESGGKITVEAALAATPGYVELRVRDTGCGILEEDLSKIFEPFYTKRRGDSTGTGLGLPVSRTMIEAMGGTMRVESTPGEGSTFVVSLQRASAQRKTA